MESDVKTWGPFSGRQLTTIICAGLFAAVMIPVGAYAVTFTNVAITDPGGVNQAKVSATGALSASVTGSVTANNASPMNLYKNFAYPSTSNWTPVAVPPAGKALVLTQIAVNTFNLSASGSGIWVMFTVSAGDATCTSVVGGYVGRVNPGAIGLSSLSIPSGVVIPAGRALCAYVGSASLGAELNIYGYTVSAASAPVGSGPTHTPTPLPQQQVAK